MKPAGRSPVIDVVVVGAGPVGLMLAGLLGRSGHSVVVLERYPGLYGLPRAASMDGEILRLLAGLGVVDQLLPTLHVQQSLEWSNADGEVLISQESRSAGDSGWPDLVMFHQPILEDALHSLCNKLPTVEVRRGVTVTALRQAEEFVVVRDTHGGTVTARYVVGCDGGNSFVRTALGIGQDDLGFSEPWLVCDFKLSRPAHELDLPSARQIGDPAGPTTVLTGAAGHQRFCFLLDDADQEVTEDEAWSRVRRFLDPVDAELIRVATYTFRSLISSCWRDRRVLLAGDAAHQMPPFLGQGMCSGLRDAANLAFKLDLVLAEQPDDVLDTYQSEREPQVRSLTVASMELGRQHTLRDPAAARERDRALRARRDALLQPDRIRIPSLGPGLLGRNGGGLSVQGRVDDGGRIALLDDIVGGGFRLVMLEDQLPLIDRAALRQVGITVVPIAVSPQGGGLRDVDGTHLTWLKDLGVAAVAVRPDNYVFAAGDPQDVAAQLLAVLPPKDSKVRR